MVKQGISPIVVQMAQTFKSLLSWLFFGIGLACALMVILIGWHGGRVEFGGVSAENPFPRIVAGIVAFVVWYFLRRGLPKSCRAARIVVGRVALLLVAFTGSYFVAEKAVRGYLRDTQGFHSLEFLSNEGVAMYPRSETPLISIVQLCSNRRLIYELRPNLDILFGDRRVITNSRGMRESREFEPGKSDGCVRILGIGDSGMFGWGVEQGSDYLSVVEETLNEGPKSARCEILNFAVPGYNTWQEVELLESRGLEFQPDIVIVGWCDNDTDPPTFLYEQSAFDERDISYLYLALFKRDEFVRRITPRVVNRQDVDPALVDPVLFDSVGPEGVVRAMTRLKALADTHGFRVLVFGPLKSLFEEGAQQIGVACLNTFEAIPEESVPPEFKIHTWHPTTSGHRKLSEALGAWLEASGWLE